MLSPLHHVATLTPMAPSVEKYRRQRATQQWSRWLSAEDSTTGTSGRISAEVMSSTDGVNKPALDDKNHIRPGPELVGAE